MEECSLTISGGGLRSAAAIGVIKHLEENGCKVIKVSGTSGGSILAILYAYGMNTDEIVDFIKSVSKWDIFQPTWTSLFSLKKLERKLRESLKGRNLVRELVICTTNIETGKPVYHNSGDMVKKVIASSSLVPFFSPVKINGTFHADGGYTDNMPNTPLLDENLPNISINVNNPYGEVSLKPKSLSRRLAFIVMNSNILSATKNADVFINVNNLEDMSLFDFDKLDWAIERGYEKSQETFRSLQLGEV